MKALLTMPIQFLTFLVIIATALKFSTTQAQTISENTAGMHNGFYYSLWRDRGDATMTLGDTGQFTLSWQENIGNLVAGLGFNPGGDRFFGYEALFTPAANSNAYFTLYGWAQTPLVEYYIIESYTGYNPANEGKYLGTYATDGGVYDFYDGLSRPLSLAINQQRWNRYYAIRREPKGTGTLSGTIDTSNHFSAWRQMGVSFADHSQMIMGVDAYQSPGTLSLTLPEVETDCYLSLSAPPDHIPYCCNLSDDPDGDGWGELLNGRLCEIGEGTPHWHPENPNNVLAAINVGGIGEPIELNGIWYEANTFVSGAISRGTLDDIQGSNSPIYQSVGVGSIHISIPLTYPQKVAIELGFAEILNTTLDARKFDIVVENKTIRREVDLMALVGHDTLWDMPSIETDVADGTLDIQLSSATSDAILSSVLVTSLAPADPRDDPPPAESDPEIDNSSKAGQISFNTLCFILLGLFLSVRLRNAAISTR